MQVLNGANCCCVVCMARAIEVSCKLVCCGRYVGSCVCGCKINASYHLPVCAGVGFGVGGIKRSKVCCRRQRGGHCLGLYVEAVQDVRGRVARAGVVG